MPPLQMIINSAVSGPVPTKATTLPPEKPRRRRQGKPKVKTGCQRCKDRRIKCDETRPVCLKCIKIKKPCPGYQNRHKRARASDAPPVPIVPKPLQPQSVPFPPPSSVAAAAAAPHVLVTSQSQQLREVHPLLLPLALAPSLSPAPVPAPAPAQAPASAPAPVAALELAPAPAAPVNPPPCGIPFAIPEPFNQSWPPSPFWQQLFNPSPMLYTPSLALPLDHQDVMYFQVFRSQMANELSGFFDSVFWARTVLRQCHSEPVIRHAVIALGALYKTLDQYAETPPSSPSRQGSRIMNLQLHSNAATAHYAHAQNALNDLATMSHLNARTILMARVLLTCYDSLAGDHKKAICHMQRGLELLGQLRAHQRHQAPHLPASHDVPVDAELVQMFNRLAIQAKSYDMAFHFPEPYVVRLNESLGGGGSGSSSSFALLQRRIESLLQDPIPARFSSLIDARLAWDKLCENMLRCNEFLFDHSKGQMEKSPMGVLPASFASVGEGFKLRLQAWSNAFDPILQSRHGPGVGRQEKTGIAVLKMFQLMGQILFLMTTSDDEMHFDRYNAHFVTIVNLATEVVADEERRAAAQRCTYPDFCHHKPPRYEYRALYGIQPQPRHIKPSFSADLGIVPPLFVVATKCREETTRLRAIDLLLTSSRREAMWDSDLAAWIAVWVVTVEKGNHCVLPSHAISLVDDGRGSTTTTVMNQSHIATLMDMSSPEGLSRPLTGISTSSSSSTATLPNWSYLTASALETAGGDTSWDARRPSFSSISSPTLACSPSAASSHTASESVFRAASVPISPPPPPPPAAPADMSPIPAARRVMVRAVEFDLHTKSAVVRLGSRKLLAGDTSDTIEQSMRW